MDEKEKTEEAEVISKKKVIYIEIDDEVTAVFDRAKVVGSKHIYVVVPKRAILFQSVVNLKILKRKLEDLGKKLYLISNDKNGIHLAQKVGIPIYNKDSEEGKPRLFSTETGDERLRITPLRASVNEIDEEAPTRLAEKKLSISEILRKSKQNKDVNIKRIVEKDSKPAAEPKKKNPKFVIVAPNRQALIGLISVSLIILLTIVYIALPGVTIYLTPSASVLEKSVNITLADYQKNRSELETRPVQTIASFPIEATVEKSITHLATGKKFSDRAQNANGKIKIINTTGNAWPLIAQTRFQTNEGLVFRLQSPITVPASSSNGPGQVEAFVVADQQDAQGAIVGERGNIGPSSFFLPGLREDSRSELYAESEQAMSGGVTDFITFVSEEDVEAAKSRIRDELLKAAIPQLETAVKAQSELTSSQIEYKLLQGEKAISIGEANISVPEGLVGKEIAEFELRGTVRASGIYYDRQAMLAILSNELTLKKSPQKELLKINEDSSTYRIFEEDTARGKIKLTANIKGIEQYQIDPEEENGARLLSKIKDHVVGLNIEQAKAYIQNLPEVNKVEIESWPFWAPTIPGIPDNIEFEIRDALTVE